MEAKTVMVVDDDASTRDLVAKILNAKGYQVVQAACGEDACEAARKDPPALIIMDIMMADMSGAEAAKVIQSSAEASDVPIVFLSAIAAQEEPGQSRSTVNVGGTMYGAFAKPFKAEELVSEVENTIGPCE